MDGGLKHGLSSEPDGSGSIVPRHCMEERFVFLTSFELTGQLEQVWETLPYAINVKGIHVSHLAVPTQSLGPGCELCSVTALANPPVSLHPARYNCSRTPPWELPVERWSG